MQSIGIASKKTLGPIGAISGFVSIIDGLSSLFDDGPSEREVILDAINKVNDAVQAVHKDMEKWFGTVIENQKHIAEKIDEIIKRQINNHKEVMSELNKITKNLSILNQENRDGIKEIRADSFHKTIALLDGEIGRDQPDDSIIKSAIVEFYDYGNRKTKGDGFTVVLDIKGIKLFPEQVIGKVSNITSIERFVGVLPMIVKYFTGNEIKPLNNPVEFGKAALALSIAYTEFPQFARNNEVEGRHYLKDFQNCISNTRTGLLTSIKKETISKIKIKYEALIEGMLSSFLKYSKEKVSMDSGLRNTNVYAVGPIFEIRRHQISAIDKVPLTNENVRNYSVMKSDFFRFQFNTNAMKVFPVSGDIERGQLNMGEYVYFEWTGINQKDENIRHASVMEVLDVAEKLGVLKKEVKSGNRVLNVRINLPLLHNKFHDEYTIAKIILSLDNGELILGNIEEGKEVGWKLSKIKLSGGPTPEVTKYIQYFSEDSGDGEKRLEDRIMSLKFLDIVQNRVNQFYNFRKNIISELKNQFESNKDVSLDAYNVTLKYLAGVAEYVATGNLDLGTAIAQGKVKVKDGFDLPTHQDIANLITRVTSYTYLYDPSSIDKRANSGRELTEYIKTEVSDIIKAALKEYLDTYFSREMNHVNIPELNIPELMLISVEHNLESTIRNGNGH